MSLLEQLNDDDAADDNYYVFAFGGINPKAKTKLKTRKKNAGTARFHRREVFG